MYNIMNKYDAHGYHAGKVRYKLLLQFVSMKISWS